MEYVHIDWSDVKPIWDTHLWPGRDSEPVTSMKYLGGYDLDLKNEKPTFIGFKLDDEIVGVNSYVRTGKREFRSRGLWVHPEHRQKGTAFTMLHKMSEEVRAKGGWTIWTMPRAEALKAYESAGFVRTSPWMQQEWGTNCYAILSTRTIGEIAVEAERYKERRVAFWEAYIEPMFRRGAGIEEMRRAMAPLVQAEEEDWR